MGLGPARGAQEEGVSLEEEVQADGRQGSCGHGVPVQMFRVRPDETDAPSLPALHAEYVIAPRSLGVSRLANDITEIREIWKNDNPSGKFL